MKRELPSQTDPLMELLDEWQAEPEVSANFDRVLRQRLQSAAPLPPHAWWQVWTVLNLRRAVAALAMLLLVAGAFFYFGGNTDAPAEASGVATAGQSAQLDPMVRDLQTLSRDGDLLDHLDFLTVPMMANSPQVQQQD